MLLQTNINTLKERNNRRQRKQSTFCLYVVRFLIMNCTLVNMSRRHDLTLEQKINLIKAKDHGLSHRELNDKFNLSLDGVSNILKRN